MKRPVPFLKQVADTYCQYESDRLIDYCFVTPNKRAGVFLGKYFAEAMRHSGSRQFLPEIMPISDFVADFNVLIEAPRIQQLFILYNAYSEILKSSMSEEEIKKGNNLVDFNRFQFWGDILLNDFNDVDRYLVDAGKLFKNVENLKEISANYLTPEQIEVIRRYWNENLVPEPVKEFWNHIVYKSDNPETRHSDKKNVAGFIKLWQVMAEIYDTFRSRLAEEGLTYSGKSYRDATEKIADMAPGEFRFKRYIFVGFNVLSTSERRIFNLLKRKGIADFYWDYASPEFKVKGNRARRFMDVNIKDYPSIYSDVGNVTLDYFPEVTIYPVPSSVGQAKLIPSIIKKLYPGFFDSAYGHLSQTEKSALEDSLVNTAIVLPDENLVQPILASFPTEIPKVNVTMGFSLRHTPVSSLISKIVSLHLRARPLKGEYTFFYDDVLAVLSHPLIRLRFWQTCDCLVAEINKKRLFNIPVSLIDVEKYSELHPIFEVVRDLGDSEAVLGYLMRLLNWLETLVNAEGSGKLDIEFIRAYMDAVGQLGQLRLRYLGNVFLDDKTIFHLVERIVGNQTVNYEGLPLSGLQIMGVLEARCLDFENVVLTSMNERIFPRKHYTKSFIPNALRRGYGMATLEHQESIYAYYFYRLISRSKRVVLLYDSRKSGGRSNGVSRYLRQLRYQFPAEKIKVAPFSYPMQNNEPPKFRIRKNRRILSIMERYRSKENPRYLSASSINEYINCPMSFYLSHIERYYPENDVVDYMDDSTYGTIVHDVIEHIYTEEKNALGGGDLPLTPALLTKLADKDRVERALTRAINHHYLKRSPDDPTPLIGDADIYRTLMSRTIIKMFEREKEFTEPVFYIKGEEPVETTIRISERNSINISYRIDRVDRVERNGDTVIRLIDYKTGGDEVSADSFEHIFEEPKQGGRRKAILQLLLYANAYAQREHFDGAIEPYIYQLRKVVVDKFQPVSIAKDAITDYRTINDEFLDRLDKVITEMFDPEKDFVARPGKDCHNCKYCKFRSVCEIPDN